MSSQKSSARRFVSHTTESSTIATPRIHSSTENSLKASHLLLEPHRSRTKSNSRRITDPHDIRLDSISRDHNTNHVHTSTEPAVKTNYSDLMANFFDTHQPSLMFEPIRKEYYWMNDPFDEQRVTRLERYRRVQRRDRFSSLRFRLLQTTSFFVQSLFWYLRIFFAVLMTVPIEIVHTILDGLIKPLLVRLPTIVADTIVKPLHWAVFNTLM
jgi:hypothetical protein